MRMECPHNDLPGTHTPDCVWQKEHAIDLDLPDPILHVVHELVEVINFIFGAHDPYTARHQERTACLSRSLAVECGLSKQEQDLIYMAAIMHDIGKIYIPKDVLHKPGSLSAEERQLVRNHSVDSRDLVARTGVPAAISLYIVQHHERLDGRGYPDGLRGSEISLGGRILGLSDALDAMMVDRVYRPSLGIEGALAEANRDAGTHFDPALVSICANLFEKNGTDWLSNSPPNRYTERGISESRVYTHRPDTTPDQL